MLNAVAELAENCVGNVNRVLCDEVNANAFGTNETNDQFNLPQQGAGLVGEEEMGLIEETYRLPMVSPRDESKAKIDRVLSDLGLLAQAAPSAAGAAR